MTEPLGMSGGTLPRADRTGHVPNGASVPASGFAGQDPTVVKAGDHDRRLNAATDGFRRIAQPHSPLLPPGSRQPARRGSTGRSYPGAVAEASARPLKPVYGFSRTVTAIGRLDRLSAAASETAGDRPEREPEERVADRRLGERAAAAGERREPVGRRVAAFDDADERPGGGVLGQGEPDGQPPLMTGHAECNEAERRPEGGAVQRVERQAGGRPRPRPRGQGRAEQLHVAVAGAERPPVERLGGGPDEGGRDPRGRPRRGGPSRRPPNPRARHPAAVTGAM